MRNPGARRIFAAAFESLAHRLPKSPPPSPTVDRRRSQSTASSPSSSSSSSSSSSQVTSTAAPAAAGLEKRGSTAAAARTTAAARSNSWHYVPGALRAIHDESTISHAGEASSSQRAASGRYRLDQSPGGPQATSNGPTAAGGGHGHGENYFDGHHGQRSPPHHPPSRPARSTSYQLPAPGPGPGPAGASRSYSYSVSYVPPTTGLSATNPAPASPVNASTAPPLPPPPVGPFACSSTTTRQQQSDIARAPRPPERTRGVAAPVVSLSVPAAIVSRQQTCERGREGKRETRRLPSSSSSSASSAHHYLHYGGGDGGGGGGGAERRVSTGAERTTTTAQRRSDGHVTETVEDDDHDGCGGGRGPTWDEVLRARREGW
ncbi:hypothetical protein DL771_006949 [Monosporascus sp. 5C6A]|nr:hypothetical protein DL771_006949 [Monosporascus sp. 5C6A]